LAPDDGEATIATAEETIVGRSSVEGSAAITSSSAVLTMSDVAFCAADAGLSVLGFSGSLCF
jgi:hypothetical protein